MAKTAMPAKTVKAKTPIKTIGKLKAAAPKKIVVSPGVIAKPVVAIKRVK